MKKLHINMDYCLLVFIFLNVAFPLSSCLQVIDIFVPEITDFRDNVTLSCSYDKNDHILNSVKWYKDKQEFFRFSPIEAPMYKIFNVSGVQVHEGNYSCNDFICNVKLSLVGANSTGVYTCEVSEDAPFFRLAAKSANMTVAALPQSDPLIEDFNSMYRMEDYLKAACASDYSSLPTKLTWYINGEPAQMNELLPTVELPIISAHNYELRRQKLQVHFYLSGPRFFNMNKILQLKCVAEIENFPKLRRETSLSAAVIHYDNLNNQMLIHASAGAANRCAQLVSFVLSLPVLFILAIFIT